MSFHADLAVRPRLLAVASGGFARVWSLDDLATFRDLGENRGFGSLAISPDGQWLAQGGDKGREQQCDRLRRLLRVRA